ncbi:MAG: TIGR03936 family radical SAM-associated protein [Anaerohalosphaeraceae bacterium]
MNRRTAMRIVFDIQGDLCVLSHRETMTMWARVLARSGLPVSFSAGFNPHPRLSLPLPRAVGVEGEGEVLWVQLERVCTLSETEGLAQKLPAGCTIRCIEVPASPGPRQAVRADYVFERGEEVSADFWLERLQWAQQQLLSGEPIWRERQKPGRQNKILDVHSYLEGIRGDSERICLVCRITPEGTLRLEEMLDWLGLKREDLAGPPRRNNVVWTDN